MSERERASEARHGGRYILQESFYNARGWHSGMEGDLDHLTQMAKNLSEQLHPDRRFEWRDPSWPIYRAALAAQPESALDVRPELVAWFHEGVEQCEHDYNPPPCEIGADALLRAFTVEPRLYEKDGLFSYESGHFRRLAAAAAARAAQPESAGHHIEQCPCTWLLAALVEELYGLGKDGETLIRIEEAVSALNSRWSVETRHDALAAQPESAGLDVERFTALLDEFDGSLCPACHHRAHQPGSCEDCPRCELHTDEALAFVLRYEPELLTAEKP